MGLMHGFIYQAVSIKQQKTTPVVQHQAHTKHYIITVISIMQYVPWVSISSLPNLLRLAGGRGAVCMESLQGGKSSNK